MNKALHCRSCNQIFSGKDVNQQHGLKTPLLLKCAHTTCESCARKILKIQKTGITCPTCQEVTPVKNGDVKSLPPDVYILGLSMMKKQTMDQATILKLKAAGVVVEPKKTTATSPGGASGGKNDGAVKELCGECCSNEATLACLKCECNMCGRCFDRVHQAKILRSHRAIAFDQSGSSSSGMTCALHDNRPYEYYCEEDKVSVCSRCVIAGEHKGHAISSLEEKNKGIVAEIDPAIHIATNVTKQMKASIKVMDSKFPDIKADLEKKMALINIHFHAMHSQLQQREAALIDELQMAYSKVTEPLHQMKTFLEEQQLKYDSLIKDARRLHSSQHAALNGRGIIDELLEAKHTDCIIKTPDMKELDIRCRFSNELKTVISSHGGVVCDEKPIGFFIEALDDIGEVETPSSSSDVECSLPQLVPQLNALSASSCTSAPSSVTSDDVIIEDTISVNLSGLKSRGSSQVGSTDDVSVISSEAAETTTKPTLGIQRLDSYHSEVVVVTHIRHPCHFTVQVQVNEKKLQALSRNINRWCCSLNPDKYVPTEIEIGDLVLAQFTKDNKWYRARVKDWKLETSSTIPATIVDVVYIDYGNSETIPKTRLRKMQKKFLKDPEFGIQCTLIDIVPPEKVSQWSQDAINTFAQMTGDTNMLMSVHSHSNDCLYVDLSKPPNEEVADDRPISVRDALVFLELAVFLSPQSVDMPHSHKYPPEQQYLQPELPRAGEEFPSYVCHVNDPCDFYVQSLGGDEVSYLVTMMNELQKVYNMDKGELWTVFCPRKGMICVAKHSVDGLWTRAKVIGLPGGKMVTVQYVDYGNVEDVNIWKLKKILDRFLILPAQAIHCKLTDVRPPGKNWDREIVESFARMTHNTVVQMKITRTTKDTLTVVAFSTTDDVEICLNSELVRANLAISTGPFSKPQKVNPVVALQQKLTPSKAEEKVPQDSDSSPAKTSKRSSSSSLTNIVLSDSESELSFFPVVISHVISPFEIYLQTTTAMDDGLSKLMDELQENFKDSEANIVKWERGDCCAVLFSEDKKWYRARILKVDEEIAEVHVLDFGFRDQTTTKKLRVMDDKLLEMPCFSLKCFLDDIQPAGDKHKWSATAVDVLKEILPRGKKCQVARKGDIVDGSLPVTLLSEIETEADALNAASITSVSVSKVLKDKGVALPVRRKPKAKPKEPSQPVPPKSPPKPKPKRRVEENFRVKYINPFPPSAPEVAVIPTYVNYDCVIFVQRTEEEASETLTDLMDKLQEEFADTNPEDDVLWEKGMLVTAQFSDDMMWYRAEIVNVDARGILVMYSDYGNSEFVPPERLRTKLMFTEVPLQCYECLLKDVVTTSGDNVWPVAHLNYIHNMIVGKSCSITIKEQPVYGQKLQVSLTIDGIDFATHLCNFGYAINLEPDPPVIVEDTSGSTLAADDDDLSIIPDPCSPPRGPKMASWSDIVEQEQEGASAFTSPFKKLQLPAKGDYFELTVTNLVTVNEIYAQFARQDVPQTPAANDMNVMLENLVVMVYEINQIAHSFHALKNPKPGMACCCQYTYDQQWYRAEIMEIGGDECRVLYVDYGNDEVQPLDCLRVLPESYLELPAMAIRFVLDGINWTTGDMDWMREVMQKMSECLGTVPSVVACLKEPGPPAVVDLYSHLPVAGEPAPIIYQDLMEKVFDCVD